MEGLAAIAIQSTTMMIFARHWFESVHTAGGSLPELIGFSQEGAMQGQTRLALSLLRILAGPDMALCVLTGSSLGYQLWVLSLRTRSG